MPTPISGSGMFQNFPRMSSIILFKKSVFQYEKIDMTKRSALKEQNGSLNSNVH